MEGSELEERQRERENTEGRMKENGRYGNYGSNNKTQHKTK